MGPAWVVTEVLRSRSALEQPGVSVSYKERAALPAVLYCAGLMQTKVLEMCKIHSSQIQNVHQCSDKWAR